jgi:PRTRC genetic system ThiF family protein
MKSKTNKTGANPLMDKTLPVVHFVDSYLKQPTNPVTVNLIGAGGTGSHVLTALVALHQALRAYDHPGLYVTVFDDDTVTAANIGRQAFADCEIGINKAVAAVSRANRGCGTNWKALRLRWAKDNEVRLKPHLSANIIISCVDTAESRFEIARLLKYRNDAHHGPQKTLYWIDFGNSRYTGQVILSCVRTVKQPKSKAYRTCASLPLPTDEFRDILLASDDKDEPSCSLPEALEKQSLYINRALSVVGGRLLETLFRDHFIENRGVFVNLLDFNTRPLPVSS